jgi:hypothetical protein
MDVPPDINHGARETAERSVGLLRPTAGRRSLTSRVNSRLLSHSHTPPHILVVGRWEDGDVSAGRAADGGDVRS